MFPGIRRKLNYLSKTMLILTRRVGEVIRVGDQTKIVVLGVKKGEIRIGFDAPNRIPIHREEIFHNQKLENSPSQATSNNDTGYSESVIDGSKRVKIMYKNRKKLT